MENRAEFNIEQAVAEWRKALHKSLQFTEGNLLELESHLLDEIERLQQLRLTDEEAFVLARHNMGSNNELITEFGKVNKQFYLINRIAPYIKAMFIYFVISNVFNMFIFNYILLVRYFEIPETTSGYMFYTFLSVVVLAGGTMFYRLYKKPESRLKKLLNFPLLTIGGTTLIIGLYMLRHYMTELVFSRFDSLYASGTFLMPYQLLSFGTHILLLALAFWVYRVQRKEKKMTIAG